MCRQFRYKYLSMRWFLSAGRISGVERQVKILQILYDLCLPLSSFLTQPHPRINILIIPMQLIHNRKEHLYLNFPLALSKPLKDRYGCLLIDPRLGVCLLPRLYDVGSNCEVEELAKVHGLTFVVDEVEGWTWRYILLLLAVEFKDAAKLSVDQVQVLLLYVGWDWALELVAS